MGYLSHFIVYFLAMIGITVLALYVYKKFNITSLNIKKSGGLKIEDALSLSGRKTLYVIRNGNERFLIAADFERTTLISKLNEDAGTYVNPRMIKSDIDLSDNALQAQDNIPPVHKPIMKEIKNKLRF